MYGKLATERSGQNAEGQTDRNSGVQNRTVKEMAFVVENNEL